MTSHAVVKGEGKISEMHFIRSGRLFGEHLEY